MTRLVLETGVKDRLSLDVVMTKFVGGTHGTGMGEGAEGAFKCVG
jgi:hypothetical protein